MDEHPRARRMGAREKRARENTAGTCARVHVLFPRSESCPIPWSRLRQNQPGYQRYARLVPTPPYPATPASSHGRGAQPPLAASPGLLDAGHAGRQTRLESNAYAGATTNGTQNLRMQCTNNQMQGECNTTRGDVMMESRSQRAVIGKQTVSSPDSSERPNNNNYVCDAKCTENAMRCDRDRDRYTTRHSDPTPTRHHPTAPGRWASTPGDSQVKHGHRRPGLLVVRAQTASPSWRG